MRPCPPSEFVRRWPGALRPIVFPDPPPALPDDDVHCLREYGLPRELTIHCHNDITLTFSGSLTPLAEVWDRDSKLGHQMGDMPDAWRRFWHLADQEYCQGGGWVCIEEETARLVVIDLDQSGPIYVLNGNMGDFYTTLAHFLDWSEKSDGSPAETAILRDALLSQDCISPDDLEDFWMNFIWAALDGDPIELAVRMGSQSSVPVRPEILELIQLGRLPEREL